jgi:hypothetical protein
MHCLVCFAMVCDYIKIFSSKFIFHQFESIRYEQCKQILPNNLSIKSFSHVVEQINLPLNLRCMAYVSLCTWSCVVDLIINRLYYENIIRGRRGHDRMVVGFKNYLCNQCLSPLMLWVRISIRARCTTLCYKVCQRLATSQWFSLGIPVSSTNKLTPTI